MSNERFLLFVVALNLFVFSYLIYDFVLPYRTPLRQQLYNQQRRISSEKRRSLTSEPNSKNKCTRTVISAAVSLNATTDYEQQQRQRWRRQLITDACRNQSVQHWSAQRIKAATRTGFSLLVDDQLRYIYCRVAKVASTTWTRVLLVATGKLKVTNPNKMSQSDAYAHLRDGYPIRRLSSYTPEQIEYRLKHYFKFVFVRHPLDRLQSAFRDRLKSDHMVPRRRYERRIIRKYRRPGERAQDKGVQFREFVRYIVDPETRKSGYNAHWRPQSRVCLPCHIDYDFVGHYETLSDDAAAVLARISSTPATAGLRYPTSDPDNRRRHRVNTSQRLASMYSDVDETNIRLLKTVVYANDFLLFGYQ